MVTLSRPVPSTQGSCGGREPWVSRHVGLTALAALLGLGACGPLVSMDPPSPDGPTLSRLEFVPDRSSAGCRVELRVHVEPPHDEIVRAVAGWVVARGRAGRSGRTVVAVKPEPSGDRFADEVNIAVWPKHPGGYWFHVQVEDRAGRRSNVLDGRMVVDPQVGAPTCS